MVLATAAKYEIRVRSGPTARRGRRDDKGEGLRFQRTGAVLEFMEILAQSPHSLRSL